MSGLANRPSTPGLAKAVSSRSSKLIRLPMANGLSPTPLAPRAGWSAAMIISRPSSPVRLRLVLASAARLMASGSATRMSVSERYRSAFVLPETPGAAVDVVGGAEIVGAAVATSDMTHLSQERFDLGGRRHGGGTFPAGADDGTGRIAETQDGLQIPTGEQSVTEGATEAVA